MSYCKYLCKNGEIYGIHVILTDNGGFLSNEDHCLYIRAKHGVNDDE